MERNFKYYFLICIICSSTSISSIIKCYISLTSIYASLYSHKVDLSIDVLNLICLLGEYAPYASSFIST